MSVLQSAAGPLLNLFKQAGKLSRPADTGTAFLRWQEGAPEGLDQSTRLF